MHSGRTRTPRSQSIASSCSAWTVRVLSLGLDLPRVLGADPANSAVKGFLQPFAKLLRARLLLQNRAVSICDQASAHRLGIFDLGKRAHLHVKQLIGDGRSH